ncbi:WhiB family transcriptional regulator [Streptomyces sp. NPDC058534]|uniref:WhiB family transcriptional regulator n=1 Tax=Streptomyces sp. NPDC058534 TaxID=3346541 RepID=UPI00365569EE
MAYTGAVPDTGARPLDWQDGGLCRSVDPDTFFEAARETEAKETCYGCPVLLDCQSWVTDRERGMNLYQRDDAVIAGLTAQERLDLDPTVQEPKPKPKAQPEPEEKHGTRACYQSGCRREECRAANRAYIQERKLREQSAPPAPKVPVEEPKCGTLRGYRQHHRRGQTIDDACRRVYAQDRAARKARQRDKGVYDLWVKGLPDGEIAARLGVGTRAIRISRDRLGLIANVPTRDLL